MRLKVRVVRGVKHMSVYEIRGEIGQWRPRKLICEIKGESGQ